MCQREVKSYTKKNHKKKEEKKTKKQTVTGNSSAEGGKVAHTIEDGNCYESTRPKEEKKLQREKSGRNVFRSWCALELFSSLFVL